ncbi:hypothetical protein J4G08_01290 [Candidatus Poribacteria bacterium]|nr:hypothetical protein [Candidatus Poribacteria bacterium]
MDWVNILSVVITTVATVVLAFFNIKYVRLVRKMLITSHRPEIIVGYNWNKFENGGLKDNDFRMFLYVKNVGRGAAYNIEFIYDKSYELPILGAEFPPNRTLDEIKVLQDGISILEQGGKRTEIAFGGNTFKFNSLKQFWEKEEKHATNITVIYEDSEKVSYNQTLTIDFCRPNYSNEFNP